MTQHSYELSDMREAPPSATSADQAPTFKSIGDNGSRPQGPLPPIYNQPGDMNKVGVVPNGDGKNGGLDNPAFSPTPGDGNGQVVEIEQEPVGDPDKIQDPPVHFDPKQKPLWLCQFIADRTKFAFFLFLGGHIFFICITAILVAAGYDVLPVEFQYVPLDIEDDSTFLRNAAWRYRDEWDGLLVANTSAELVGERTKDGDFLQLFFRSDNCLTKERLEAIREVENTLTSVNDWQNFCKQTITNGTASCNKPISLVRFFDGSLDSNAPFNDPTFSDIPGTLYAAKNRDDMKEILFGLVGKSSTLTQTVAESDVTRTVMFTGIPRAGQNLSTDSIDDQNDEISDFLEANIKDLLEDYNSDGVAGMDVFYVSYQILLEDILDQVILDMALALGSFLFIFFFMLFQTGSLFLTGLAIASIFTSFLGCNLIYRIIFDFRYFGIFHVLSIFIILGIGADNIFVFYDTWRATDHENHPNLSERLSSCYRRAAKSMMNTSLTTFAAFFSNFLSPLMGVNTFGIFSATLVLVNFLSAVIFFPACVMFYHKYWEEWSWPCFLPCRKIKLYPCADKDESKTGHRPNAIVRFFGGPFTWFVTHKIIRWVLIVSCTSMFGVFIYFVIQTEIAKEPLQLFREGHNYYEAAKLDFNGFEFPLDDRNVKVMLCFGMKEQDRGSCHKSDFECKGESVWDNSFDMNPKPAQRAVFDLCDYIKNMTGPLAERLRLKKQPGTTIGIVDCFVEALDDYLTEKGLDASLFTPTLDLSLPVTETKTNPFFAQKTNMYNATHVGEYFYRYFETMKSYWLNNGYSGETLPEYGDYSILIGESPDPFDTAPILNDPSHLYGTRLRYAAIEVTLSLIHNSIDFEEGLDIYDAWEEFAKDQAERLPPTLQGMIQFTPGLNERNTWHEFKRQKALAESARNGILFGIILAYLVLACATMNFIIALMATGTIIVVTISVSAFIPILGWEVSVIESINLSLVVGLAVDYVVHLSEAYHTSPKFDRTEKVRDMLESMGMSVLSGAFSTLGSASFMFFAQIQFFVQFGVFLFLTIGFSLTYSLFLFTPLLSVIGPQGHQGSVIPMVKWVWYKIIGRKKTDIKCGDCKGKGYRAPRDSDNQIEDDNGIVRINGDGEQGSSRGGSPDDDGVLVGTIRSEKL